MSDTGRSPVSAGRQGTETGIFTVLAMYAASVFLPQAPVEVQAAAAGAATALVSALFSKLRDARKGGFFTGA